MTRPIVTLNDDIVEILELTVVPPELTKKMSPVNDMINEPRGPNCFECRIPNDRTYIRPDLKFVYLDPNIAAWLDANISYTPTLRTEGRGMLLGFRTEADLLLYKLSH